MKHFFIILLLSLAQSFNLFAGGPGDRDTVQASVNYGSEKLFPKNLIKTYTLEEIFTVCQKDDELDECLTEIYLQIICLSPSQINLAIDSISKCNEPNYALINELTDYLRNRPRFRVTDKSIVDQNNTAYPAHSIYKTWNPHIAFGTNDSVLDKVELTLTNSETNCDFHHPLSHKAMQRYHGIVTSKYGWRDGKNHNGVDLELHQWDSVYSMFPGVVRFSKRYAGFGKVVIVRHYNGLETLYAHLSKIDVKSGDIVEAGTLVGLGGQTGNARGTHLHMEVRYQNIPVNPEHLISFENRTIQANTFILKKSRHGYIAIPEGLEEHIVSKGDYISKIAKRYGMSIDELCKLNNISRKQRLKVGESILVKY